MAQNDPFALSKSGFNAFLFAEVGTELNGSPLTLLSTLARLGKDPWAQAAEWAGMPVAAAIPCLTQSITQMPLCPRALAEAGTTSARLVRLLPRQGAATVRAVNDRVTATDLSAWLPRAAMGVVLAIVIAAAAFVAAPPAAPPAAPARAPVEQTSGLGG
jgi:hypothetical protein